MIQFNQKEREKIQNRGRQWPRMVQKLKGEMQEIMEGELLVPETGIANWSLYYYCPDCSVQLTFERKSPRKHHCPCCNKVFQGEPYDSSWWELVNGQNYRAAHQLAVIWMATGERKYAEKAVQILTAYARNYPHYQIHGSIPYNGPGRAGAQTLDEANFLRAFAVSYDILSEVMTEAERILVRDSMLVPGAEFLLEHRHRQLHNHEVVINSAIAVIGILCSKEEYVKAALYEKYGLLYQLENGVLDNGMWFEGTFGYHFYALDSFLTWEKFALHTPHSHIHHPNYRRMLEVVVDYLQPDGRLSLMNDTNYGHLPRMWKQYVFAFRELGGEKLAYMLSRAYPAKEERENLETLLYGADIFPDVSLSALTANYHTEPGKSGHTVLRGKNGRFMLLKHDRYGGEHDHYDRLGISYMAYGCPVSVDLGTTGYGAKMHYDYYKNTGTHNTLVIGEENQAPVNGRLTRYEEKEGSIYVEAEADWTAPYQMPDTFTIVQWNEENYRLVKMRRIIVWTEQYFVEAFLAGGIPEGKTADWVWHVHGKECSAAENDADSAGRCDAPEGYFVKKPFCYLQKVKLSDGGKNGVYQRTYRTPDKNGNVFLTLWGMNNGQVMIDAVGPGNPSSDKIAYVIERRCGQEILAAHVMESWKEKPVIEQVRFVLSDGKLLVYVTETEKEERMFVLDLEGQEE